MVAAVSIDRPPDDVSYGATFTFTPFSSSTAMMAAQRNNDGLNLPLALIFEMVSGLAALLGGSAELRAQDTGAAW